MSNQGKVRPWADRLFKSTRQRSAVAVLLILVLGVAFTGWMARRTDRQMRADLLRQTQLVAQTVNIESVQTLTGTEADLDKPEYRRLKEQLAALRATDPKYRFIYLLGKRPDGTVFFFVGDCPVGHEDEAPAGMTYDDVPEGFRHVLATGIASVEGPFTDRWGSFVSGCIPLKDRRSGKVLAILAVDFDARDWKWSVAGQAFLPVGLAMLVLIGIVLVGAHLLARRAQLEAPPRWTGHLEPILVIAVGLVLTLFVACLAQNESRKNQVRSFHHLAESRAAMLDDAFRDLHSVEIEGLARFYEGSEYITEEEFCQYVGYLTRNPVVQAWGWVPVVPAAEKELFEQTARAEGMSEFEIRQRDAAGNRVPETGRKVYYPVFRAAPKEDNRAVIGFDLGSEPVRRAAIEEALRSGLITATDPVTLFQETGGQKGMLVFRPVFADTQERQPRGLALAVLRLGDTLAATGADSVVAKELLLAHGAEPSETIATSWGSGSPPRATLSANLPVLAFGKTFIVTVHAGPEFLRLHRARAGLSVGLTGLLLTVALATVVSVLLRRRQALEGLVRERSAALRASEEHFRFLVDYSHDLIWMLKSDGVFSYVSRSWEGTLGYEPSYMIEKAFQPFVHPDDVVACEEYMTRVLDAKKSLPGPQYRVKHADGTWRWHEGNITPVYSDDGSFTYFVGVSRDITERKQTEEALKLTQFSVDKGADSIIWIGPDASIRYANEQARRRLGYSWHELLGMTVCDFDPDFGPEVWPERWSELRTMGSIRLESRHRRKNGTIVPVEISANYIAYEGKEYNVAFIRDITERKREEERREFQLKFQRVAAEASAHLTITTTQQEFDEALDHTLRCLGELFEVDRSYVFSFSEEIEEMTNTHEWCAEGIEPQKNRVQDQPTDSLPWWKQQMLECKPLHLPDVEALPIEAGFEKQEFRRQGIRSLLCLPTLSAHGKLTGFMGFDSIRRVHHWPDDQITMLQLVANTIGGALARQRAEQALKDSQSRLDKVVSAAQDAIIMLDPDGNISMWNSAAGHIFGYSSAEAMGQNLHKLLAPQRYHEAYHKGFAEFVRSGTGVAVGKVVEVGALRKDGEEFPVELSLSSIQIKDAWHAVGILRDITERKRAEDELRRVNRYLEETTARANQLAAQAEMANAAKSQFLATMSHEIRTPMNGIIGMTGLLLDTDLTDGQREYVQVVQNSGDSLLALINDILDFSKIEAGKLELEELDFDIRDLLEDFGTIMAVRAHEKGLEFICAASPEVPSYLKGDAGRLRQILTNLVGNAIKFTEAGEVVVQVELDAIAEHEAILRFSVRDTGIGIAADKLDHIFERFSQEDGSTTRKYGGTGLGLAISKQLVEMMSGTIGLNSTKGKGSDFWFTAKLGLQLNQQQPRKTPAAICGKHILIVDDNTTNREILKLRLTSWGAQVVEAKDGPTALATMAQTDTHFDVVITDMQMPEMDGLTLGKMIRQGERFKDIPLMMMTSLGLQNNGAELAEIGFAASLTKPVRPSELHTRLTRVLSGTHSAKSVRLRTESETTSISLNSNARILLAEDNITNQQVAIRLLQKLGLKADAVANGIETLKALEMIDYDLVIMDVQMPEMDGLEATRKIRDPRSAVRRHDIPIIAMTANAMQGDREKCLNAGMDDYLTKPITPGALAEVLKQWLGQKPEALANKAGVSEVRENGRTSLPSGTPENKAPEAPMCFDTAALMERCMGDIMLSEEILNIFLSDIPRQIDTLRQYLANDELQGATRQAHNIKGAAANVGAESLRDLALSLETAGRHEDRPAMKTLLSRLEQEFLRIEDTMNLACLSRETKKHGE